jgi:hypothetical protein
MRKFNLLKSRTAAVVTGAVVVVGLGTTGATAAGLIGSEDIRNNSIQAEDIRRNAIGGAELDNGIVDSRHLAAGAVGLNDLRPFTQEQLDNSDEVNGLRQLVTQLSGELKTLQDEAAKGYAGANWGIVDRNVIGAGDAFLRSGPSSAAFGADVAPPLGVGSLGIRTATATDKVAFGNQVDFVGMSFADITAVGYSVFTTGENNAKAPNNMPSITFEIDPNLESSTRGYSSLVFAPNNSAPNAWTDIAAADDANGAVWGLTGADMPCNINGARCTWTQLQEALNDGGDPASIHTVQITKGRDFAFSGAVDALTINDQVFDFEPTGVK